MNNLYLKSSLPIIILVILVLVLASRPAQRNAEENNRIEWVSLEKALRLSQKNPKPILVEIYTQNCHKCQSMEKNTFTDSQIVQLLNEKYYVVRLDAQSQEEVFFAQRKIRVQDLVSQVFKVSVYPTLVYLDNEKVSAVVPYHQSPKELESYLEYYAN